MRKPPDSNMYFFGVTALDRFKVRLKDYPQYCQHISCIEHFKDFPPFLIKWVEYGMQNQLPPGDPPTGKKRKLIFNTFLSLLSQSIIGKRASAVCYSCYSCIRSCVVKYCTV